jgi:hypothetical protein
MDLTICREFIWLEHGVLEDERVRKVKNRVVRATIVLGSFQPCRDMESGEGRETTDRGTWS